MSNLGDVIDFIDNLTDEAIDTNIAGFRADIAKAQGRIEVLAAIKRARALLTAEAALPAPAMENTIPEEPPPTPPQPAVRHHTNGRPAPARSPERLARLEGQTDTLHKWLLANGRANVSRIYKHTGIHFRRSAKLMETNPERFRRYPNGEWEAR